MVDKILKAKKPEDLFKETDPKKRKKEYLAYVKKIHPDLGFPEEIMHKLTELYEGKKDSKIELYEIIVQKGGKEHKYKVLEKMSFELGEFWVGKNNLTYIIKKEHKTFYENAIEKINSITYPSDRMKEQNEKFMPKIKAGFETKNGDYVLQLHKTEDVFRLGRIKMKKGNFEAKHAAWVITRLLNIKMILDFNGLVHNGITLDNCYCSPQHHSIILNGGWWYTTKVGAKMTGTTSEVLQVMSVETKTKKQSSHQTDLNAIKDVGRRLVGGSYNKFPKAAKEWFLKAESEPFDAYEDWEKVLVSKDGFVQRKFQEFEYVD